MSKLKLVFWSPCPNPHLGPLFVELFQSGIDIKVMYESPLDTSRSSSGWQKRRLDERYECLGLTPEWKSQIPDWQERVHIIPGFGSPFLRGVVVRLTLSGCQWIFLGEGPNRRRRWAYLAKRPLRKLFAFCINRYALGALAIGAIAEKEFLNWGVRREKIGFLSYTPDVRTQVVTGQPKLTRFVFVGQMIELKNVGLLLRAFSAITLENGVSSPSLHLYGDGPDRPKYEDLSRLLGLGDKVFFHGVVAHDCLMARLSGASVLVLPSEEDGWGAVLNEAAQAGLALVASSNCGAAHHLIKPGVNGFRFESGDLIGLRRCLQAYTTQPSLAVQHGQESQRISEAYLPAPQAHELLRQIQSWLALAKNQNESRG